MVLLASQDATHITASQPKGTDRHAKEVFGAIRSQMATEVAPKAVAACSVSPGVDHVLSGTSTAFGGFLTVVLTVTKPFPRRPKLEGCFPVKALEWFASCEAQGGVEIRMEGPIRPSGRLGVVVI